MVLKNVIGGEKGKESATSVSKFGRGLTNVTLLVKSLHKNRFEETGTGSSCRTFRSSWNLGQTHVACAWWHLLKNPGRTEHLGLFRCRSLRSKNGHHA